MQIRNQTPLQWLLALALFFVLFNSWAANSVVPQAVPDWVSTVNVPKINPALVEQSKNGVHYLLADRQVKVSEDQPPAYFHHYADYIVNQTGVEYNSQVNIDYDPHYQHVALHSLRIIRDKLVIDKLNTARISTFQREKELEKLIYNGTETINIIIDDVRVGDIIEYSYTRYGANPAYQNIFAYSSAINWSVPVGKFSLKLFWGKSTSLLHELRNSNLTIQQTSTSQGKEYSLEVANILGVEEDPNNPAWFRPNARVYFSELSTWQQVNNWAGQYYLDALISNSNLQSLTQQIKQQNPDLKSQISAALQFVQDEVRYLGIELNDSSHIPTPAVETLNNRYGDCKDKTVLLIAILKSLGLKAYPALVNTEDDLSQVLPNVKAFDHVITYFEYQDKQYWVDPTSSFQHGNLDSIYQPNFGYALVLGNTVKTLVAMPSQTAPHAEFVIDNFDIPEQGPIRFTSTTEKLGWYAEEQRYALSKNSPEQIQKDYLEFFQGYYPNIEVAKPIKYVDDTKNNKVTSTERYNISEFWEDKPTRERYEATFYPNIVSSLLDPPKEKTRTSPYSLGFLRQINQQIKVNFSDDNWEFSNESFIEDNPFFRFSYQVSYAAATQQLTLTYGYQSKVEHVTAVQYPDYLEALEKTQNYLSYSIFKYYPNQIANNDNLDWLLKLITPTSVTLLIAGLYLLIFILWRIERRNKPEDSEVLFFPVSMPKLVAMWLLTFGFYGIYWFYKNFQFIKKQENNSSMPWARGLFSSLWYYSLWRKLKTDNDQRFDSSHLPSKWLSILLAIAFFIVSALGDKDVFHVVSLLISALIIAPLANYILFVNKADSVSLKQHSKWSVRHYLLAVISIPLLVLQSSSAIGLIPSDTVVKGSWLLDHDIKFMQRQGVIKPGDSIDYFYSDAFLFVSDDGNGFTQRHVFSYWKEDQQPLYKELANYEDIQDIQVSWSKELADHSTVTIVRSDGSRFVLYVSNSDRKDKKFVAALKKNWQNYN